MFRLFFSFDGRIGRRDFLLGIVVLIVAGMLGGAALALMDLASMVVVINLLIAYPAICVIAKRLHDRNHSGWWQVVVNIAAKAASFVGTLVVGGPDVTFEQMTGGDPTAGSLFGTAVSLAFYGWLALAPGLPGRNQYGAEPPRRNRAPDPVEVFD